MSNNHQDLVGRGAIHPFSFVSSVDPSLDSTNSVQANKAWVDTSGSVPLLKIRNPLNTGWTTILGAVVGRPFEPFTELDGPFMTVLVTKLPNMTDFEPFTLLTHI